MGILSDIATGIRKAFADDKDKVLIRAAQGATGPMGATGFNLLQSYGYDALGDYLRLDSSLLERYSDYEEMDDYPEISSAIDIFADDCTQPDTVRNRTVWAVSDNARVRTSVDRLLHTLRADEEVWEIARSLVKYGNDYEELLVNDDGVIGLNYLPAPSVRRIEGRHGELYGFLQDPRGKLGFTVDDYKAALAKRTASFGGGPKIGDPGSDMLAAFEDWEVVHFRLRGKERRSVYGHSVMESARWIWRRLMLLEDAAMIYRLHRAPERFAFYLNVGDRSGDEALTYVNRMRQMYRKKKYVNPSTNKLDVKYDALPVAHDTPIPLLDGRTITIAEMASEHAQGIKHWVYSIDRETGHVQPGEVSWVGKTREAAPAVRVTFDDGNVATMAPDHPVMRRDCRYVNAVDLQPGDSVMPFYRQTSDKSAGDQLQGYELVYDPEAQSYRYTHRVVSAALGLHTPGQVIHHKNFDRRNNAPGNLVGMRPGDHNRLHRDLGFSAGRAVAAARRADPDLDARLRAASARNLSAFNRTPARRALTIRTNQERDQGAIVRRYNESPQHAADNAIRSAAMTAMWADPVRAEAARSTMRIDFPRDFVESVRALLRATPEATAEDVVAAVNASVVTTLRSANAAKGRRKKIVAHRHLLLRMYRQEGFAGFRDFKAAALEAPAPSNHKVVSVEFVEPCDHYCMTVEQWHNFALCLRDADGHTVLNSGVFVKNSQDDDFYIPFRSGEDGNRVELLGAPAWQHMDDVEYFRSKLFAAMKIPKAYLGDDQGAVRAVLSSQDIRFARTVLRIQRELRNGFRKIARVHLAAQNLDPNSVDLDIGMTVPSSLLELAQIEARAARADLAGRMKDFVSLHWVLSKVFNLDDKEIEKIFTQRQEDAERDGKAQAAMQGPMGGMGGPDMGGGPDQGMPPQDGGPAGENGLPGSVDVPPPPPGTVGPYEGRFLSPARRQALITARRLGMELPSGRTLAGRTRPITERELFAGANRESEKRNEERLEKLLRNDKVLAERLREVGSLVSDLRGSGEFRTRR